MLINPYDQELNEHEPIHSPADKVFWQVNKMHLLSWK